MPKRAISWTSPFAKKFIALERAISFFQDARANGESEQRLYGPFAWREAPYYTERERAAQAWTEGITLIADNHVPDQVYDQARKQFSEHELADLTLEVIAINGWNRLAISFHQEPGTYQPASRR